VRLPPDIENAIRAATASLHTGSPANVRWVVPPDVSIFVCRLSGPASSGFGVVIERLGRREGDPAL
jgi:hypothetical protein